jgi:hypothetical protein
MRYPEFREKGFFVGSGVIEAGCKSIVGVRLKQSGMFWTVRSANAVIALRCCRFNQRFEDLLGREPRRMIPLLHFYVAHPRFPSPPYRCLTVHRYISSAAS